MSERLRDIPAIAEMLKETKAFSKMATGMMEAQEVFYGREKRIRNAIDYCNRMLGDEPNSQQLMYLTRIKAILAGDDDGRANGGDDAG